MPTRRTTRDPWPHPVALTPAPPDAPAKGSSAKSDAAAPTLTPALVAKVGDTGPAARVLMEALVARGLLPDAPASRDGGYGKDDSELVLQFQRDNGLADDGEVGPQTWSKLLATVKPGDTGPMVKVLQTTLIVRSLIKDNAGNLDGAYGPLTQQRVRDFQQVSGIDPIATVGPRDLDGTARSQEEGERRCPRGPGGGRPSTSTTSTSSRRSTGSPPNEPMSGGLDVTEGRQRHCPVRLTALPGGMW